MHSERVTGMKMYRMKETDRERGVWNAMDDSGIGWYVHGKQGRNGQDNARTT